MKSKFFTPLFALGLACACVLAGPWTEWIGTPDTRPFEAKAPTSTLTDVSNALVRLQPGGTLHLTTGAGEWGTRLWVTNATLRYGANVVTATNNQVAWDGLYPYLPGASWVCVDTNGVLIKIDANGTNFLASPSRVVSEVVKTGTTFAVSGVTITNNNWRFTYGASGITADVAVERFPLFSVFTLKAISDTNITSLTLFQAQSSVSNRNGTTFAATSFGTDWVAQVVPLTPGIDASATNYGWVIGKAYPDTGLLNESLAFIACPSNQYAAAYSALCATKGLPARVAPDIGGENYWLVDVTQANVAYWVAKAKASKVRTIYMLGSYCWDKNGNWGPNLTYWPDGLRGMRWAVAYAKSQDVDLGAHFLGSVVDQGSTNFSPASPYLLTDANYTLYNTIASGTTSFSLTSAMANFIGGGYYRFGTTGEVVLVSAIANGTSATTVVRGQLGTTAASHTAGDVLYHLGYQNSALLVDHSVANPIRTLIGDNLAYCGITKIYCDGEDRMTAHPRRFKVQGALPRYLKQRFPSMEIRGSGYTPHWSQFLAGFTLGDKLPKWDKEGLAYKTNYALTNAVGTMAPSGEVGWCGIESDNTTAPGVWPSEVPATKPDGAEAQIVAGLAYGLGCSFETLQADALTNGWTDTITAMWGKWNTYSQRGQITPELRNLMKSGEWTLRGNRLHPVNYTAYWVTNSVNVTNIHGQQPPSFRLYCVSQLGPTNQAVVLWSSTNANLVLTNSTVGDSPGKLALPTVSLSANLATNRILFAKVTVNTNAGTSPPVIYFRLKNSSGKGQPYYLNLGAGTGTVTRVLSDPAKESIQNLVGPSKYNWYDDALAGFTYTNVTEFTVRWAQQGSAQNQVVLNEVYALGQAPCSVTNPVITLGNSSLTIPLIMTNGTLLEVVGQSAQYRDRNGNVISNLTLSNIPMLTNGVNTLRLSPTNTLFRVELITTNAAVAEF